MTKQRMVFAVGACLLAVGVTAGVFASSRNTSQDPPPFMRGRTGGPGGPREAGGAMGMLPMLGPELGMTDAQREQIRNIVASHRDEWKTLGDRARAAHEALQQAVTAEVVDEALIRQRSAEAAVVEADLAVARAHAHAEVFQILTPEQKAKAREKLKVKRQK
jgi:Spy/CpxP family protein refolding chaperone